jgi:hypothetical protein
MSACSPAGLLLAAVSLGVGLLAQHGPALSSGFDWAPGDQGDARIMIFLIESTMGSLLAGHDPRSPPMFYPITGALGFTDAHLLWVAPYTALRAVGLEHVRAFSALIVGSIGLGYIGFWLLAARVLRAGAIASAAGASLFAFANALCLELVHGQLIGVIVVPFVVVLIDQACRSRRATPGLLAGLLMGLLAATSFEIVWFALFFTGIALGLTAVVYPDLRRSAVSPTGRAAFLGFVGGLAAGLVPFVLIYWMQLLHGVGRDPGEAKYYSAFPSDLINVWPSHPLYGPMLARLGLPQPNDDTMLERSMGFTPLLWLLAVVGFGFAWVHRRDAAAIPRLLLMAVVATLLGTALELRGGHAWPWGVVVFHVVPGASAIRTPFRSQIVALVPVCAIAAYGIDGLLRHRGWRLAVPAVLVWLVAETVFAVSPYRFSASAERAIESSAPPPPAGCVAFALAPQAGGRPWWQLQTDALMLSLRWNLPTINGNSSWYPPTWDLLRPQSAGYAAALDRWVAAHKLHNICVYGEQLTQWQKVKGVSPDRPLDPDKP